MSKPIPTPIDPARVRELALAVVVADRFPMLATIDGEQPRVRPVSPVKTDQFTIYVANLRAYHKTAEIAANARVELCYMDDGHNQVRISGLAETVTDRAVLEDIWQHNPLLRQYLGTIDNPQLIVYCVRPTQVRYMQEWALEYYEVAVESAIGEGVALMVSFLNNDPMAEDDAIELHLMRHGLSEQHARKLIQFVPIAFTRYLNRTSGVRFASDYVLLDSECRPVAQRPIAEEQAFREAWRHCEHATANGANDQYFLPAAARSGGYRAIQELLDKGLDLGGLVTSPPMMME